MTPLVTIVTPSLNQGRYLRTCIDSVARQDYSPIEHIVCDGGSTDDTLAILRDSTGVTWFSGPDSGQADAVNRGISRASGEIIGWINSDDALFSRDAISNVVKVFQADDKVDVVFGNSALVSEDGLILRQSQSFVPRSRRVPRLSSPISQPAMFFRRRALEPLPALDVSLATALDLDLVLRLLARGARFRSIARVLAIDRDHRMRKMRTMLEVYERESPTVVARYGFRTHSRGVERCLAWARRLRGLPEVVLWKRYEPAADWKTDGLFARVARQLFVTHFAMHARTVDDRPL